MENPATWGRVKNAIYEAIKQHERNLNLGTPALSEVSLIYEKLYDKVYVVPDHDEQSLADRLHEEALKWAKVASRVERENDELRKALHKILDLTRPAGYDSGHTGVVEIAEAALK